jgi:uncharacterized membrane protein
MKRRINDTLLELLMGIVAAGVMIQLIQMVISGVYEGMVGSVGTFAAGLWPGIAVGIGLAVHMYVSIDRALDMTQEDAEKDRQAYPAVDVLTEYLKMERWLAANPKNRKTNAGIKRFINSWLGRAQNSARPGAGGKVVSAQQYDQRKYSEDELMAVSDDLIAEARAGRGKTA